MMAHKPNIKTDEARNQRKRRKHHFSSISGGEPTSSSKGREPGRRGRTLARTRGVRLPRNQNREKEREWHKVFTGGI